VRSLGGLALLCVALLAAGTEGAAEPPAAAVAVRGWGRGSALPGGETSPQDAPGVGSRGCPVVPGPCAWPGPRRRQGALAHRDGG